MTKISAIITNSSDVQLNGLKINAGEETTLKVFPSADTTEIKICAVRADFIESQRTGEDDTTARGNGQELIDEGMVYGKIESGSYQDISGFANALTMASVTALAGKEFTIKVVVPEGAETLGAVGIGLAIRCR